MTEIMVSRMFLPPAELSQSTRAEFMALQVTEIQFLQAVNVGHQGGYVSYSQAGSCPPLENHRSVLGCTRTSGTAAFDAVLKEHKSGESS